MDKSDEDLVRESQVLIANAKAWLEEQAQRRAEHRLVVRRTLEANRLCHVLLNRQAASEQDSDKAGE
ncbi:MAG: hypothetical protein JWQ11_2709 [Rhizobacter sp.]|nr:hypothetical protein [Rhizobacter sp.]